MGTFRHTISQMKPHVTTRRWYSCGREVSTAAPKTPEMARFRGGMFGPDTVTWRVNRELALLLGGGRALLLQVAHPLVAAGVAEHSDYREDPWGRLFRTLDLTTRVAFGSARSSRSAADRIWAVHGGVHGTASNGAHYDARDPDLLTWVWATLVDTTLLVYRRWVDRLDGPDLARYHAEQVRFAEAFGIPAGHAPATPEAFREYWELMLADELHVTDEARDVADATFRPHVPLPLRPAFAAYAQLTAGLLPPSLREGYGVDWGPRRERGLDAAAATSRAVLKLVPTPLRTFPEARRARRRSRGQRR